ncbi:MAG: HMA2 domain-containing protein [Cyanobacteria bacterium P01_B01_bin.77]
MVAISESPTVPTSSTTVQLGKLLDEYSEVAVILPVLAGLLVTSRLQLRGANALIVNLTIAAISRQIMHQLKHEATASPAEANGAAPVSAKSAEVKSTEDDYKVLHSVPGRLRLQIPQLREDQHFSKRLETSLLNDSIVSKVRLNRAAASVVIQYRDSSLSELDLGLRLLKVLDQAKQTETVAA